jgi:hypothetical protein
VHCTIICCIVIVQGFSVTIPHKEAAHKAAASRDPVADQIGACNTLIRQPDGSGFKGYNTDWIAAISAIERVMAAGSSEAAAATSSSSSSSSVEGQPSPLQVGSWVYVWPPAVQLMYVCLYICGFYCFIIMLSVAQRVGT